MSDEIKEYEFHSFNEELSTSDDGIKAFTLEDIKKVKEQVSPKILAFERKKSSENSFRIDERVWEYRGLKQQEADEKNAIIEREVKQQVDSLRVEAEKEGYEEGIQKGREELIALEKESFDKNIQQFEDFLHHLMTVETRLLEKKMDNFKNVFKSTVQWAINKQYDLDQDYFIHLFDRVLNHLGDQKKISFSLSANEFDKFKDQIDKLKEKDENYQFKIDGKLSPGEIEVETENNLVRCGREDQFKILDKILADTKLVEEDVDE